MIGNIKTNCDISRQRQSQIRQVLMSVNVFLFSAPPKVQHKSQDFDRDPGGERAMVNVIRSVGVRVATEQAPINAQAGRQQ